MLSKQKAVAVLGLSGRTNTFFGGVIALLQCACTAAGQVEDLPTDLNAKPIQHTVIQACVRKWAADRGAALGPWAYDGGKNLYAPKPLTDRHNLDKEKYEGFPVEVPAAGRRFPGRYKCVRQRSAYIRYR